jgi:(E)-4-hydroxy-3-methylbut-2-enyl-diphosphate synthase
MTPENYTKSQKYCESLTSYVRRKSLVVNIGDVPLGGNYPIRLQSMTTTDTMDTAATIAQSIRMIEAGCEYVRITAPSINEAQNLENIKKGLRDRGYSTPLIADIHFTPNAAEVAARIVEKVRVNPGNYVDKKKFEIKDYTDSAYEAELERIRLRFEPLVKICKEYGTAMRIGTNHGSLSDRIMNRYGDTPMGMVESAMEFLRICESLNYRQVVLSMKASNPQVMVQAYRLLVAKMNDEDMHYPLHLGVTEAGEAEEGRIKSAMGIGALLEDGLGDTVRVSLTEEPEFEIPVARDIVRRYEARGSKAPVAELENNEVEVKEDTNSFYSPFTYTKRETTPVANFGGHNVPRVFADLSNIPDLAPADLSYIGYRYDPVTDKWNMGEQGADYIYFGRNEPDFMLPTGARGIYEHEKWVLLEDKINNYPVLDAARYAESERSPVLNFLRITDNDLGENWFINLRDNRKIVFMLGTDKENALQTLRNAFKRMEIKGFRQPVIISGKNFCGTSEFLLQSAADLGGLLIDGFGDGVSQRSAVSGQPSEKQASAKQAGGVIRQASGNTKEENLEELKFVNETLFYILQASRTRISKTEYISCPSCGRTLFDLQETTAIIRAQTDHLKGVKIAIMGCIVNGPGEMADADYGYVGTGPGKITLYRGKEVVKRNISSESALNELINLIKEDGYWIEKENFIVL